MGLLTTFMNQSSLFEYIFASNYAAMKRCAHTPTHRSLLFTFCVFFSALQISLFGSYKWEYCFKIFEYIWL